jgi:phage-related protein
MVATVGRSGRGCELYALLFQDRCLVREYIQGLSEKEQKQVMALLYYIQENGPPFNEERFRRLEDDIYELKTWMGARLLAFFDRVPLKTLILTHGFDKPKKKELARETKKAAKWRWSYFDGALTKTRL